MGRRCRMKYADPTSGYYHIFTSIVQQSFLLDDIGKNEFLAILRKLSQVYFVRVVTFAVMSNHIHLILRMVHTDEISDEEVKRRHFQYYNAGKPKFLWQPFPGDGGAAFRKRFGDLSKFVQDLKQRFARWCNTRHGKRGHVWGERFTSVMLEGGRALTACMVYVELNSVRAGMVSCPEHYRWCGLYHYVSGGRLSSWLDHETFGRTMTVRFGEHDEEDDTTGAAYTLLVEERMKSHLKRYLSLIYREGRVKRAGKARMSEGLVETALREDFSWLTLSGSGIPQSPFTRGVFLGSKRFCDERFHEFRDNFQTSRERTGHPVAPRRSTAKDSLFDFYSIRRLR